MSDSRAYNAYIAAVNRAIAAMMSAPSYQFAMGGIISTTNRIKVNSGITSTGMHGFSEEGSPGEWDMSLGEVYGYRWWKILVPARLAGWDEGQRGGYAVPLNPLTGANGQTWGNGQQEARCTNEKPYPSWPNLLAGEPSLKHEPPEAREPCGCGFWAYFDPMLDVTTVLGGFGGQTPSRSSVSGYVALPVFGVVKGTGRVIIGEKGFRSQYAEIVGLTVSDAAKDLLKWNFSPVPQPGSHVSPNRNVDALRNALRGVASNIWGGSASSGRMYSYDASPATEYVTQASEETRLYRCATVESMLSTHYPSARVFSDQGNLVKYFPPDKNYAA